MGEKSLPPDYYERQEDEKIDLAALSFVLLILIGGSIGFAYVVHLLCGW